MPMERFVAGLMPTSAYMMPGGAIAFSNPPRLFHKTLALVKSMIVSSARRSMQYVGGGADGEGGNGAGEVWVRVRRYVLLGLGLGLGLANGGGLAGGGDGGGGLGGGGLGGGGDGGGEVTFSQ